ncbi:TQO small subunit DoxD, partial [Acidianus sp. RZ1]|uniref:TQO small subunit DoxD n=1 Tax=Acidianus sp. RZ1 TaxID=1540082 RepID=UPI001490BB19
LENRSFDVTFLTLFSYIEIIAGLFIIIGFLTRLAAFGAIGMSVGFAPAYWLGSTCEDEWQIGALLTAGAVTIMLTGAGRVWGIDSLIFKKLGDRPIANVPILKWIKLW